MIPLRAVDMQPSATSQGSCKSLLVDELFAHQLRLLRSRDFVHLDPRSRNYPDESTHSRDPDARVDFLQDRARS